MVRVSIDIEAATGVVSSLRTFFDEAMDEWTAVSNAAGRALCSTTSLKALSDPLVLVSQSAKDLETRVELAVLVNTGDDGVMPTSGVVSYELSGSDTIENVKDQLGRELADGLRNLDAYDYLSRQDVEELEHYTTLMEKYANDPAVTDGLFDALGPQGVVELPVLLKDFAKNYQQHLMGHPEEDISWDEDTPMSMRIADLQQRFMEAYGTGLATSTGSDDFNRDHPDFADQIVQVVTEQRAGLGWGLSQILRYGDYDADFLTSLGTGLYDWEIEQYGPVWAPQVANDEWAWRLGTDDDGQYFDPFVGLFEAMGRNPEAAADFFNPDGGGEDAQERSKYLIQERTWRADDFNALGEALDAASTTWHNTNATPAQQEQAAWIASATVYYLGQRDGGHHGRRIGDAGKDSLAHILATYIYDVDRVAQGTSTGTPPSTHTPSSVSAWDLGLPPGANFSLGDLNTVLGEVLTDDTAMVQLADATAALNAHRIETAVEAFNNDPSQTSVVSGSVQTSAKLTGYLLGNLERGTEAAGKEIDERNKQFIDLASDVVGLIPTGKTFTSFLADQARSQGKDAITSALTGNEGAAGAEAFDAQQTALTDLQIAMAVALADSPHLPESATTDQNGDTYPWFVDGGFDESRLEDPEVRSTFQEWITEGAAGDLITDLIPDLSEMYDAGITRGKGA